MASGVSVERTALQSGIGVFPFWARPSNLWPVRA